MCLVRQDDDGAGDALFAQGAAQLAPVAVGKTDIEHHELVETFRPFAQPFRKRGRLDGLVHAAFGELLRQ